MSDPVVVDRRRLELTATEISGSKQPYHTVERWPLPDAQEFLTRCRQSTEARASAALLAVVQRLSTYGYRIEGGSLLLGSGRPLGSLASILASHALIHTAEGEFYRDALRLACEQNCIRIEGIKERQVTEDASAAVRLRQDQLKAVVDAAGKQVGSPWRQDEKLAMAAAWLLHAKILAGVKQT